MSQLTEQQICHELSCIWGKIYDLRKILGEEHELYDSLYKLSSEVNSVECQFFRFIEKEKSAVIGVTTNL